MDKSLDENVYKKLFNIHYKNKIFTIFLDKFGRKTFLEVSDEGKYRYPLVSDFVELHKIYNEKDPFISYLSNYNIGDTLPIHKPRKVIFKEAVLDLTGIISVVLTGAISLSFFGEFKIEKKNDVIEITPSYNYSCFDDTKELNQYLGNNSVSEEELIAAINNNPNLSDYIKDCAIKLAKHIKENYPNTDNRIFYDNIKTLRIEELEDNEDNKNIAGCYNSKTNTIGLKSEYFNSNDVILHELNHAYHCWSTTFENENMKTCVIRSESKGHCLGEAMTEKIILAIEDNKLTPRINEQILNYLLTFVEYNYYDYEQGGITRLYNTLEEKYPGIDIDYIFNSIDAIHETELIDSNFRIEECSEFLDCLFDLCTRNINSNIDIYESLYNFLQLINISKYYEVAANYINEYNDVLKQYGFTNIIQNDDEIINYANELKKIQMFDNYLENLNIETNSTNVSLYKPLQEFIKDKHITSYKAFCDLLEKYNNFLMLRGTSNDDIISVDEFLAKSKKYQNLNISGYTITNDGNIYFNVEIPEKDKVYNQDTRVPVLDKDGKVTLLNINDIRKTINYSEIKSIFNWYLLTNAKDDLSWYDGEFFENELNVSPYDYKKVSITLNGKAIASDYIDNLTVIIGMNEDGTNSFKLINKNWNTLYQDGTPKIKVTIAFADYINISSFEENIELTEIFNKEYLKQFVRSDRHVDNKNYMHYDEEKDKIVCEQGKTIILDDNVDNEISIFNVGIFYNSKKQGICLEFKNEQQYLINDNIENVNPASLGDVLDYYGKIDDMKYPLKLTTDELIGLFNKYLEDEYGHKITFTLNGKEIGRENLDDLMIVIGMNEDGTNSFKLKDKYGSVKYQDGNPVVKVPFKFTDYIGESFEGKNIELTEIFNKDYLKQFIQNGEYVKNKEYLNYDEENDKIICKQEKTVIVDGDSENEILMGLIYMIPVLNQDLSQNKLIINHDVYTFNIEHPIEKQINLYDVLNYYGLYDDTKSTYKFSTDEIINLFSNYLNDVLNMNNKEELNTEYNKKM